MSESQSGLRAWRSPRSQEGSIICGPTTVDCISDSLRYKPAGRLPCRDWPSYKLYDGDRWEWLNLPIRYHGKQKRKYPGWTRQAAKLVQKPHGWYLHVVYEAPKPRVRKVSEQKKDREFVRVNVDLNLNHYAVVSVIQNGKVKEIAFFRGHEANGLRLKLLRRITKKQHLSGRAPRRGESFCKDIWGKIRNQNRDIAHRVSRRIVDMALAYEPKGYRVVIVFEHLGNFRRKKGERKSRHLNAKLAYWLRGKILKFTKYKAWNHGIITVSVK